MAYQYETKDVSIDWIFHQATSILNGAYNASRENEKFFLYKIGGTVKRNGNYLKLANDNLSIDLQNVPQDLMEGDDIVVEGMLTWVHRSNFLVPVLKVKNFEIKQSSNLPRNLSIKVKELPSFWDYINKILHDKEQLSIVVIHGRKAQTQKDFMNNLSMAAGKYVKEVYVSFIETALNDEALLETLSANLPFIKEHDLLVIIRGGGSEDELSNVGGEQSARFIVENDIKMCLGLGHSLDRNLSFLERVAIGVFRPSGRVGTDIGELVKIFFSNKEKDKEIYSLLKKKQEQYNNLLREKEIDYQELLSEHKELKAKALAAVILAAMAGFLLSKFLL